MNDNVLIIQVDQHYYTINKLHKTKKPSSFWKYNRFNKNMSKCTFLFMDGPFDTGSCPRVSDDWYWFQP